MNFSQRTEVSNCCADCSSLTNTSRTWAAHLEGFAVSGNPLTVSCMLSYRFSTRLLLRDSLAEFRQFCHKEHLTVLSWKEGRHFAVSEGILTKWCVHMTQTKAAALIWLGIGNVLWAFELCPCRDKPRNGKRVKSVHLCETLRLLLTHQACGRRHIASSQRPAWLIRFQKEHSKAPHRGLNRRLYTG